MRKTVLDKEDLLGKESNLLSRSDFTLTPLKIHIIFSLVYYPFLHIFLGEFGFLFVCLGGCLVQLGLVWVFFGQSVVCLVWLGFFKMKQLYLTASTSVCSIDY